VTNLPDLPKGSTLAAIAKAKTPAEKAKALSLAGNYTTSKDFPLPVPAFFLDLPIGDDNDAFTDQIALAVLTAENPDDTAEGGGSISMRDLVGQKVTVWDLRAKPGEMASGWKAFLLLDITVGDSEAHKVANTGAKQIVTRLARAFLEGAIPVSGIVTEIATPGNSGNKPLAFVVDAAL
jgi:hypothetical protein